MDRTSGSIRIELLWLADDGDEAPIGLVVPCPTGVIYTQQAGGTACIHPEAEGFYVPLPAHLAPEEWLRDYWGGPYNEAAVASLIASNPALQQFFRALTPGEQAAYASRYGEFAEAWVPMMVELPEPSDESYARALLEPLNGRLVILTYPNSD